MLKGGKGSVNGGSGQTVFVTSPSSSSWRPKSITFSLSLTVSVGPSAAGRMEDVFGSGDPSEGDGEGEGEGEVTLLGFQTISLPTCQTPPLPVSPGFVLPRALVVSLHDVSPLTHQACVRIMTDLKVIGVPRVSLLVIPDHHGRGHFLEAPEFCAWLKARAGEGQESVTHGYFHRRERREREDFVQRMITRVYTADEGEFYDIDRSRAVELVGRANSELRGAGLEPRGFLAAAWLLSSDGESAL